MLREASTRGAGEGLDERGRPRRDVRGACCSWGSTAPTARSSRSGLALEGRPAFERGEEVFRDRVWGGRAARDADVDGEQLLERPGELGGVAEDVAAERAVAERGDEPGLGHRVVGGAQRRRPCGW